MKNLKQKIVVFCLCAAMLVTGMVLYVSDINEKITPKSPILSGSERLIVLNDEGQPVPRNKLKKAKDPIGITKDDSKNTVDLTQDVEEKAVKEAEITESEDKILRAIRIGIFNSKKQAQKTYENFDQTLRDQVQASQLWLVAYKNPNGFIEFHLEISNIDDALASSLCDAATQEGVQCYILNKQQLYAKEEFDIADLQGNDGYLSPDYYAQILAQQKLYFTPPPPPASEIAKTESPYPFGRPIHPHMFITVSKDLPLILKPLGLRFDGVKQAQETQVAFDNPIELIMPGDIVSNPDAPLFIIDDVAEHNATFKLDAQELDGEESKVAKAAYDTARNRFLAMVKNTGEAVNNGDADERAFVENLVVLGQDAFQAAGDAYLTSFMEKNFKKGEALSQEGGSGSVFRENVSRGLMKNAQNTAKQLVNDLFQNAVSGGEFDSDAVKKRSDEFFLANARSIIDSALNVARQSDLYILRNLEFEYNLNDFEDSYFSILGIQPIYQTPDLKHNAFLQASAIINEQSVDIDDDESRHTFNLGGAYRYLTDDQKYLIGGNVFVDYQLPYNHARMSIGADVIGEQISFATNYYQPLTGFKDSRTDANGILYEEQVLGGYDAELGYNFETIPNLSVFGKTYQFFRDTDDDILGFEASAEYEWRDFTFKGSYIEENAGRDGVEFILQYRVPLYDTEQPNLAAIDMAKSDVMSEIFRKVRRENRLRVEERAKGAQAVANLTAQFDSASTGLPFLVGGSLFGADTDLPEDSSATIPSGSFAIVEFSNGAIANMSAAGVGDIIFEFNDTTLTITQTGGGFVQFISASGGISVVNVPGGTVNLTGTDIDVTDDGTTTTVQVRAGQIQVVPDIGAAVIVGNQGDIVSLTQASGATSLLVDPALTTRQEDAYTNLDSINPSPPFIASAAPFIKQDPVLITGPQFAGNNADIRVTFAQPVNVGGSPQLNGLVDGTPRIFTYEPTASSAQNVVFRYVFVLADENAANITVQDINLNGGTIVGSANGLNALTAFTDVVLPITDQTGPSLVSSVPVDNEPNASVSADIVLTYNENIQAGTGSIVLTDLTDGSDTRIIPIGDAQISISTNTLTLDPTTNLEISTDYEITIASGVIQDALGNNAAALVSGDLNFTSSSDAIPPLFVTSSPLDNATQVARANNITLTFDEDVLLAGTINLTDTDDGSDTQSFTSASPEISITNNVITINPGSDLEYAENYEITYAAGAIEDLNGNGIVTGLASGDLNFQTVNLEAGLTLTGLTTGPDGNIDEGNVQGQGFAYNRNADAVFAAEIRINAAPLGVIYETGATGQGIWIGFNQSDGVMRARAGSGAALLNNGTVNAEAPLASFPPGDYTLTWEVDLAADSMRVWLDENLVASSVAVSNITSWAGTDNGGYGTTASNVPSGEITTAYNDMLLSTLRYYAGQTIP